MSCQAPSQWEQLFMNVMMQRFFCYFPSRANMWSLFMIWSFKKSPLIKNHLKNKYLGAKRSNYNQVY